MLHACTNLRLSLASPAAVTSGGAYRPLRAPRASYLLCSIPVPYSPGVFGENDLRVCHSSAAETCNLPVCSVSLARRLPLRVIAWLNRLSSITRSSAAHCNCSHAGLRMAPR